MSVATARPTSASRLSLGTNFLRNLTSLLITSRLIGESLAAIRADFLASPEVSKKITGVITTGLQGEIDLRKPLREAGIVLPAAARNESSSRLLTNLYSSIPTEGSPPSRASETVLNLRLVAQHLELRARLTAEEAKLIGEESLHRVLLNWARQWWTLAHA